MKFTLIIILLSIPCICISKATSIDHIRKLYNEGNYNSVLEIVSDIESPKHNGDVVGRSNTDINIINSPEYQHYKLSSTIFTKGLNPTKDVVYGYDKLYRLDLSKQFVKQKHYGDLVAVIKKQSISSYKASHYQTTKMYVDALARWGDTTETYNYIYSYKLSKDIQHPTKLLAKTFYQNYDYTEIDKFSLSTQHHDIETLTWMLTKDYNYKHEKIRALYTWVTKNIVYDYTFKSESYKSTFRSKKGTCAGYTDLLNVMLGYANIESDIVVGYADNGNPNDNRLHAWTVVKLGGYDFWLDSTWDAVLGYQHFIIDPPKLTTHKQDYIKKAR